MKTVAIVGIYSNQRSLITFFGEGLHLPYVHFWYKYQLT